MAACTCYPNPADHEDDCPARLGEPERIEYACRWTDWDNRSDEHKTRIRIEVGGYGDEGRRSAEHCAAQTRQWQPHHGLPADAVVVSRPVHEWAVVDSPTHP